MAKPWLKKMKEDLLITLAPLPGALLIKGLHASLRIRHVDRRIPEGVKAQGGQYIMAFWHGDLLMMVYAYVGQKLTFLVSWHRDGELITRVMKYFGMNPTRGSTTRGGIRALHSLLKKVKEGYDIAFTSDGFMIPYPFTRLVFAYGEPIPVPRELDEAAAEAIRLRVEDALKGAAR